MLGWGKDTGLFRVRVGMELGMVQRQGLGLGLGMVQRQGLGLGLASWLMKI
jgi:hypothetical protein